MNALQQGYHGAAVPGQLPWEPGPQQPDNSPNAIALASHNPPYETEQSFKKPPARCEGISAPAIARAHKFFRASQQAFTKELDQLKTLYVFPPGNALDVFLANHRSLVTVLRDAVNPLKDAFGAKSIFRLELSIDDDDSTMLYGVAVCHSTVREAAEALDRFEEDWWLDHMTRDTVDLAFTYKLA